MYFLVLNHQNQLLLKLQIHNIKYHEIEIFLNQNMFLGNLDFFHLNFAFGEHINFQLLILLLLIGKLLLLMILLIYKNIEFVHLFFFFFFILF